MPTIIDPAAGDRPWTSTGTQIINTLNAMTDYFIDVSMVPAGGQTIAYATFTKIALDTEASDVNNDFNTTTNTYTVPATGRYLCCATVRVEDNAIAANTCLGVGINAGAPADFAGFLWNVIPDIAAAPGNRYACQYLRIANFTVSDAVTLFCYHDAGAPGGATLDLYSAAMQIWRIK